MALPPWLPSSLPVLLLLLSRLPPPPPPTEGGGSDENPMATGPACVVLSLSLLHLCSSLPPSLPTPPPHTSCCCCCCVRASFLASCCHSLRSPPFFRETRVVLFFFFPFWTWRARELIVSDDVSPQSLLLLPLLLLSVALWLHCRPSTHRTGGRVVVVECVELICTKRSSRSMEWLKKLHQG